MRTPLSIASTSSTVRFFNADGHEFMTLKSDDASKRFESLFDEAMVGVRHAEDGELYAILKDGARTREEPGLRVRASHHGSGGGIRAGRCDGELDDAVRSARDGDPALHRERSRLPALSTTTTRSPALCAGLRRERRELT